MKRYKGQFRVRRSPISLWRYQLGTLSLIGMMTIVAVVSGRTPVQAALLASWRFDPATNQLEVTLQDRTTPRYFLLAQPARIVLDLPNTQLGKVATQQNYSGAVRQVRVSQFEKGVTRIVLELSPEVVLAPGQVQLQRAQPQRTQGDRWLLRPGIVAQITPAQTQIPSIPSTFPPAINDRQQVGDISVPTLTQGAAKPVTASNGTQTNATLPPATFGSQQPTVVTVPPLGSQGVDPRESRSTTASTLSSPQPTDQLSPPYRGRVIEFGQPLPKAP